MIYTVQLIDSVLCEDDLVERCLGFLGKSLAAHAHTWDRVTHARTASLESQSWLLLQPEGKGSKGD